jgi:hypothetical protein
MYMSWEDNCKLSSIEKIDFVLDFLALPENKGAYRSIDEISVGEIKWFNRPSFYDSITREDLVLIIMKLLREKHVVEFMKIATDVPDEIRFSTNLFRITFDGLLWRERGGYRGDFDRQNAAAVRQATEDQHNKYLLVITYVIGVGTSVAAVYYGIGLCDYCVKYFWNWRLFFYFLSGIVVGLLMWLTRVMWQKVLRKPKKDVT